MNRLADLLDKKLKEKETGHTIPVDSPLRTPSFFLSSDATAPSFPLSQNNFKTPSKLSVLLDAKLTGDSKAVTQGKLDLATKPMAIPDFVEQFGFQTEPGPADPTGFNLTTRPTRTPAPPEPDYRKGFFESAADEFRTPARGTQYLPIVGGAFGAAEHMLYLDAARRLQQGYDYSKPISSAIAMPGAMGHKPATYTTRQQDEKIIGDMILRAQEASERGYTFGGKVAKHVMILPTWMIEFALTGGLAKIGNVAVQEAGEQLLKNYAKGKTGQTALKLAGWTGGAITRGSLGLAPRVVEKATERQVNVQILGDDQEGWATSFAKGWGDVVIEAASEEAGAAITGIPARAFQKTKLGKKFVDGLRKTWQAATGGSSGAFVRQMATKGGYSNIIGEIGEERLGTVLRAITDIEDFGAGKDAGMIERLSAGLKEDAKNLGVEAVVLSIPMAAQASLGQVVGGVYGEQIGPSGKPVLPSNLSEIPYSGVQGEADLKKEIEAAPVLPSNLSEIPYSGVQDEADLKKELEAARTAPAALGQTGDKYAGLINETAMSPEHFERMKSLLRVRDRYNEITKGKQTYRSDEVDYTVATRVGNRAVSDFDYNTEELRELRGLNEEFQSLLEKSGASFDMVTGQYRWTKPKITSEEDETIISAEDVFAEPQVKEKTPQGPVDDLGGATAPVEPTFSTPAIPAEPDIAPAGIVSLPTEQIKADPERFQFKLDTTAEGGVSEKLASVEQWNERSAGTILVWEDKDGQQYVVDGHHRLTLAKKLGVKNVNAWVVRETDGVTEADARVMGAMGNLADEKGTAVDAAKIFRESDLTFDNLKAEGVDTKNIFVRQGMEIKNLSDEVFRMVIDGKVPANMAAQIGKHVTNPTQQMQVATMIVEGQVDNTREAEMLAKTIDSAPVLTTTEQTLFGAETKTKSLYAERAKVLANVERILKTNKKVFGVLSGKAGIIEQAGNVLDKEANLQAKQQADEILYLLEKLANAKGPVSEALNEATKQYAEQPTKQRLSEITTALLDKWQQELTFEKVGKGDKALPGRKETKPVGLFEKPAAKKDGGGAAGASVAAASAQAGSGYGTIAASEKNKFAETTNRKRFRDAAPTGGELKLIDELLKIVSPGTRAGMARPAARAIRQQLGQFKQKTAVAQAALRKAHHAFTFMNRVDIYEFIDRMENGQPQATPKLQAIANQFRKLLDGRRDAVQALGKGHLEQFYENYFPHLWKDPSKAKNVILQIMSKRRLEGSKAFLKKRTIMTVKQGREYGLELVSENPVDLVLLKVYEMDRYLMAHRLIQDLKSRGLIRFVYSRSRAPEGYVKIDDRAFTVYMPPEITKKEAYDSILVDQLMDVARSLGIDAQRFTSIGGTRWGYAQEPQKVRTKFGGPESVLIHEIGHILGFKYGLYDLLGRRKEGQWARHKRGKKQGEKYFKHSPEAVEHRRTIDKEWRDLADARFKILEVSKEYKNYVRKSAEKEAVLLEAMLHAPEEFERTSPTLFKLFKNFLNNHSELRPLLDVKPSLVLGSSDAQIKIPGYTVLGHYYTPEPVGKILNNYLSPGLRNNQNRLIAGGYNLLRMGGNILNQAQLALSGFHGLNVTTDMIASTYGEGIRELSVPGQRLRGIGNIVTSPVAPFRHIYNGVRLRGAYRRQLESIQDPRLQRQIEAVILAGGTDRMDPFYYNRAIRALKNTAGNIIRGTPKQRIAGVFRLPFDTFGATLEILAKPLMEWYVPTGKMGLFAMIAEHEMKRAEAGQITDEQLHERLVSSWDSVDNRMGQLIYDNLFWNKTFKDVAMLAVRSVGWNLGSWREYGGVPLDILGTKGRIERGDVLLSQKMAYTIGAVTLYAVLGSVIMYLLTGQKPEEPKDYFFPKTGRKNPDGSNERLSLPTYAKDWWAYGSQPVQTVKNKIHPMWGVLVDLGRNKDFFNAQIRGPEDPISQQLADVGKYISREFLPLSIRNYQKMSKTDPGAVSKNTWVSITGITSAPVYIARTPAQKLMYRYIAENISDKPKTKEQAKLYEYRKQIKNRLRKGDPVNAIEAANRLGTNSWKRLKAEAAKDPFVESFSRLSLEQAFNVYVIANTKEQELVRDLLEDKAERNKYNSTNRSLGQVRGKSRTGQNALLSEIDELIKREQ